MPANHLGDLDAIVNIFFQDGFNLAREYLSGGVKEQNLSGLMSAAYEAVDGLILSFRNRCQREGLPIDCRDRCAWCCHQAVLVSTQEVLPVSRFIEQELTAGQQQLIYRKAREKEAITGAMTVQEFLQTLHPCPFLRQDSCLIYAVRPMACRCYLSANLSTCQSQYHQPGDPLVMASLYDFPLRAGRSINEGIRAVLMQHRLITSEWLFEVFISRMSTRPGLFDEWLAGKDPFKIRSLTAAENQYLREYRDRQGSFQQGD
jgi:Fe-S-cluster containining protein